MSQTYALYDIVDKINGGGIVPIGETHYDNKAFLRMKEIETLIEYLVDDMLRVYEQKSYEASVRDASKEAEKWFKEMKETIDEILEE